MRTLKAVVLQKCRKVLDTKCGAEASDDDQEAEEMREMVEYNALNAIGMEEWVLESPYMVNGGGTHVNMADLFD